MTNDAIMQRGMELLVDHLGVIEAERFVFNIKSEEPFNYTEWRKTQPWYNMTAEEINEEAKKLFPQKSFGWGGNEG
ncbi:MAG: hypothetical protein LBI36_03705 [Oscillospiraceae bacterium]|nr:hypothetical protein [Oscillospiraceae bacterium]